MTNSDTVNLKVPQLIVELCKQFYQLGWVTGTGGGISIRENDVVYVAPSGVQKERIKPEDVFAVNLLTHAIIHAPQDPHLKMSQCAPLFWNAYILRPSTTACIHTHSMNAMLATMIEQSSELKLSHFEMIKGIRIGESGTNHRYTDTLVIPIIENTAEESQLKDRMAQVIASYPDTNAVLVRRHGVYVWGESWEKVRRVGWQRHVQAKTMAECYDYLFEAFVRLHQLGINAHTIPVHCADDHTC